MTAIRQTVRITWALAFLLAVYPFMVGCNGTTTTAVDDVIATAVITLEVNPDPVNAQPSTSSDFQWMASLTLTVSETAGVGGVIDSIFTEVNESSGGIVVGEAFFESSIDAETNRVDGNSSTHVRLDFFYTLIDDKREALVTIVVWFVDDNNFEIEATIRVSVT